MCEDFKVLDGGFSTQLTRYVGNIIDGDALWTAGFLQTDPDSVVKTHLDFLEAGADIIITNSYQASIEGFMEHFKCDWKSSYNLIKKSVKLAVQARNAYLEAHPNVTNKPLVAGSVGPYGAALHDGSEYTGSYIDKVTEEKILNWHRPRVKALVEEGIDLFAIETIPAYQEAEYLLELIKEFPDKKAWLSFQCKDSKHTARGDDFKESVRKCWSLNRNQLIAVGCNCVNPKYVSQLLRGVNDGLKDPIPLIVYPNSGEEYSSDKGYEQDSRWSGVKKPMASKNLINEWIDLGVRYIGGCCRTDVDDIANIRKVVRERMSGEKEDQRKVV